ncbi:MAG TPA: c-type cytochrome, partial [Chryseosolibacter sp.]
NEPPIVGLDYRGNRTFFFDNNRISYRVTVSDKEDGTLASGKIPAEAVAVSIDYVSEGFRFASAFLRQAKLDSSTQFVVAQSLIGNSDCKTCHTREVKSVGPSFRQIAERYKGKAETVDTLVRHILRGSSGVWDMDNNMPAHPSLPANNARIIVNYILSINSDKPSTLPVSGTFVTRVPEGEGGKGTYIIRAAYTDHPVNGVPSHTVDSIIYLRSPKLNPLSADVTEGGAARDQLDEYVFLTTRPDSFIAWKDIDLTGVSAIRFRPNWHLYDIYPGGKVEIHLESPDGQLIGETTLEREQFDTRYRGAFGGLSNMTEEQKKRSRHYPPIDERKFFAPGSDKNAFTIPSIARVKSTPGKHDIYFVFKNDSVPPGESLFPLAGIEMMR